MKLYRPNGPNRVTKTYTPCRILEGVVQIPPALTAGKERKKSPKIVHGANNVLFDLGSQLNIIITAGKVM